MAPSTNQTVPDAVECRFVNYVVADDKESDLHLVKEVRHFGDVLVPGIRLIKDFEKNIYVTKKRFRNHQDKKEWELIDRLDPFPTTELNAAQTMAKALDMRWARDDPRKLRASPYVYGNDTSAAAIIKRQYQLKYPKANTPYSVAVGDTETDVVDPKTRDHILMATYSQKKTVVTYVQERFVKGIHNVEELVWLKANEMIGDVIKARGIERIKVEVVPDEISVVKGFFGTAHQHQPDFLTFWNMLFDIKRFIEAFKRANVDPKDIVSDPRIPEKYRYFKLDVGDAKKVTNAKRTQNLTPEKQWHTVYTPASFYLIDSMCSYRHVRVGEAEIPSYSLDFVLKKHLKRGKVQFAKDSNLKGLAWHFMMQKNHPIEYIVYNIFDCIGIEMLDEETLDLQISVPMFSNTSTFDRFNSQPKRLLDDLYHFLKENHNRILGSGGNASEFDDETVGLSGWITALPAEGLDVDGGLHVVEEDPSKPTNVFIHGADLDVTGSYPHGQIAHNISKETTRKELVEIHGVPEQVVRMQSINMSGAQSNAVEICTILLGLPTPEQLFAKFIEDHPDMDIPITAEVKELLARVSRPDYTSYGVDFEEKLEGDDDEEMDEDEAEMME